MKNVRGDSGNLPYFAGGKIMDSYANWDALGMMQQLGVLPALAEPKGAAAR